MLKKKNKQTMLKFEKTSEVWNNKQNLIKRIIKKANRNTEGCTSKFSFQKYIFYSYSK